MSKLVATMFVLRDWNQHLAVFVLIKQHTTWGTRFPSHVGPPCSTCLRTMEQYILRMTGCRCECQDSCTYIWPSSVHGVPWKCARRTFCGREFVRCKGAACSTASAQKWPRRSRHWQTAGEWQAQQRKHKTK